MYLFEDDLAVTNETMVVDSIEPQPQADCFHLWPSGEKRYYVIANAEQMEGLKLGDWRVIIGLGEITSA